VTGQVVGTGPLDAAAHLKLLGESLSVIGARLQEHKVTCHSFMLLTGLKYTQGCHARVSQRKILHFARSYCAAI